MPVLFDYYHSSTYNNCIASRTFFFLFHTRELFSFRTVLKDPAEKYREQWKFGLPSAPQRKTRGVFCIQNMAESSSASTAPSGGPGAKSSSSTWWKSLSSRKKIKEIPPLDPSELLFAPPNSSDSWENQSPIGNRRNLKISHSGRFKEKRKPRTSLLAESPQKLFEGAGGGGAAPPASPAPAHPSEETRGE